MRHFNANLIFFIANFLLIANLQFPAAAAKEVKLTSKNFQREFLQNVGETITTTALEYLNNYLKEVQKPLTAQNDFDLMLKLALDSKRLEPKIVFIKQYLDLAEHKDTNRENMYGLRNVNFLKKLKNKFIVLQEESFEEIHQLRYFYLCKQFKKAKKPPAYHNYYGQSTKLVPVDQHNVGEIINKLGLQANHTVYVNVTQFGSELYKKVNEAGSDAIDDYLIIIRKLLQEVLEPQSEEEATVHSEALRKILAETETLLKIRDFYKKRQRLNLENHLAVDNEQIQSSESSQHDLKEIFSRLNEKGPDLEMAILFSDFEFTDYVLDQWALLLPQAPISLYDAKSRPLKNILHLYGEFKQDFENSSKYDAYLEAVEQLHKQTQLDNADTTHIYEMLFNASQNVDCSIATLIFSKCSEVDCSWCSVVKYRVGGYE